MSSYDEQCSEEFARIRSRVEPYFVDLRTACPYGLAYVATFHQAMFGPVSERVMELFLAAGYRRNGNCLPAEPEPEAGEEAERRSDGCDPTA